MAFKLDLKSFLIALNIVLTLSFSLFFLTRVIRHSGKKAKRICKYELKDFEFHYKRETDSPNIIMLGNSLISYGQWNSLLNRKDVINRGIAGDNLQCMCERVIYLDKSSAQICFIEGGINDLPETNVDTLFSYYVELANYFKSRNKIPVINLPLYISPKAGNSYPFRADYVRINKMVKNLNDRLLHFSIANNIDYIDLNSNLSLIDSHVLKDEYTTDGVHLTESAYKIWAIKILNILKLKKI